MYVSGSVAEWSKALVLGTSLLGGVGSNPTAAIHFAVNLCELHFHFSIFFNIRLDRRKSFLNKKNRYLNWLAVS